MLSNCGVGEGSWESQPVNPKGNQSWIFIGRTDAEAETPILWPPDEKNGLTGKDPDAGRDWGQEEKGTTEDEMAGWHHRLDGHEFEQALGAGDGQGSLACCSPWGHKESFMTEGLNGTEMSQRVLTLKLRGTKGVSLLNVSLFYWWIWGTGVWKDASHSFFNTSPRLFCLLYWCSGHRTRATARAENRHNPNQNVQLCFWSSDLISDRS